MIITSITQNVKYWNRSVKQWERANGFLQTDLKLIILTPLHSLTYVDKILTRRPDCHHTHIHVFMVGGNLWRAVSEQRSVYWWWLWLSLAECHVQHDGGFQYRHRTQLQLQCELATWQNDAASTTQLHYTQVSNYNIVKSKCYIPTFCGFCNFVNFLVWSQPNMHKNNVSCISCFPRFYAILGGPCKT
jgi:hypothetical protein